MDSEFQFGEMGKSKALIQSVCSTNTPFKSSSIIDVESDLNTKEREQQSSRYTKAT